MFCRDIKVRIRNVEVDYRMVECGIVFAGDK